MKKSTWPTVRLRPGSAYYKAKRPEISIVSKGRDTYIWIGEGEGEQWCYATLHGAKTLEKFAKSILSALKPPAKKRKPASRRRDDGEGGR